MSRIPAMTADSRHLTIDHGSWSSPQRTVTFSAGVPADLSNKHEQCYRKVVQFGDSTTKLNWTAVKHSPTIENGFIACDTTQQNINQTNHTCWNTLLRVFGQQVTSSTCWSKSKQPTQTVSPVTCETWTGKVATLETTSTTTYTLKQVMRQIPCVCNGSMTSDCQEVLKGN